MLISSESRMDSGHTTLATADLAEHTGTRGHEVSGHGSHNDSWGGQGNPVAGPPVRWFECALG